jgi:hypothetical protein
MDILFGLSTISDIIDIHVISAVGCKTFFSYDWFSLYRHMFTISFQNQNLFNVKTVGIRSSIHERGNSIMVRFEVSTAVTMMIIMKLIRVAAYTRAYYFVLCLLALVHPEYGGDTILRNVGSYKSHTASSPRR